MREPVNVVQYIFFCHENWHFVAIKCPSIPHSSFASKIQCNLTLWRNCTIHTRKKQVFSSSWDGRPFGHKRHGPKSRGLLRPFLGDRRSEAEATAGHKHWRRMAHHSLPNNYFRDQEMSIVVCNRGGKSNDAKWLTETLIGSSKVAQYVKWCRAWLPWRTIRVWKSGDESSAKWRLEDKVWKAGNMATKIMGLVVYNITWVEAYLRTQWHIDPSSRLATTDMGRKLWRAVPLLGGGSWLGPHLTQCGRGRGLPLCQVSSW